MGLIALPFFTILFAMVETALIFFASVAMEGAMEELKDIEQELVVAFEGGIEASAEQLHAPLERHREFVTQMWGSPCSAEGFEGLADLYKSHPDFIARYERLSPKFSDWLPAAMGAHAVRLRLKD